MCNIFFLVYNLRKRNCTDVGGHRPFWIPPPGMYLYFLGKYTDLQTSPKHFAEELVHWCPFLNLRLRMVIKWNTISNLCWNSNESMTCIFVVVWCSWSNTSASRCYSLTHVLWKHPSYASTVSSRQIYESLKAKIRITQNKLFSSFLSPVLWKVAFKQLFVFVSLALTIQLRQTTKTG